MVTRIERPRSRLCVLTLGLVFLLVFVVLLGIGDGAPKVLLVAVSDANSEGSLKYRHEQGVYQYYPSIESLTRESQLFWMEIRLSSEDELLDGASSVVMSFDMEVEVKVDDEEDEKLEDLETFTAGMTQKCKADEEWCSYMLLWKRDFVDHDGFMMTVTFEAPSEYALVNATSTGMALDVESRLTSINPEFTRFEMAWKYLWLCMTLLVMFCPCGVGFLSSLKRKRRDTGQERTYHQKWTVALLWALVWFDDPFVAATVYTNWSKLCSAVFILSASIFVFLILLFWLCFLSDLRFMQHRDGSSRRGVCYWLPKVILTLAIGVTVLGGYMYYRFENTISFEYTGVADEKKAAEELAGLLGFMLAVYMLWAIVLILRSCGGLRHISPSYVLMYFVTLLSCLVAVIGVFVAAYYPYSTSSVAFVGIHGLMNLYIWTLAVSFAPVRLESSGVLGIGNKAGGGDGRGGSAVTGTEGVNENTDMNGWEDPMDSDFKAVEL